MSTHSHMQPSALQAPSISKLIVLVQVRAHKNWGGETARYKVPLYNVLHNVSGLFRWADVNTLRSGQQ
jgi:hypothetical protein